MKRLAIRSLQKDRRIDTRLLRTITLHMLEPVPEIRSAEVAIQLLPARRMADINQRFLNHTGATDVITFDYQDPAPSAPPPPRTPVHLHGEILICVAIAIRQATEFNTHWTDEVVRYVAHGFLHLLGHDDLSPTPRRLMKTQEARWLERARLKFNLRKLQLPPPTPRRAAAP